MPRARPCRCSTRSHLQPQPLQHPHPPLKLPGYAASFGTRPWLGSEFGLRLKLITLQPWRTAWGSPLGASPSSGVKTLLEIEFAVGSAPRRSGGFTPHCTCYSILWRYCRCRLGFIRPAFATAHLCLFLDPSPARAG